MSHTLSNKYRDQHIIISEIELILRIKFLRLVPPSEIPITERPLHSLPIQKPLYRCHIQLQHNFTKMTILNRVQ